MSANSSLLLTSLDFDTLKANFIVFLQTQSIFKDINFAGANINVLLDVLSYNSYLNAFYMNMVASEMFLDSAQKLDSVVSHAKELNYLPRSTRSPVASVAFNLDAIGVTNPIVVPQGTTFTGTNSNGSFSFVTNQQNSYLSSNTYVDSNGLTHTVYNIANLAIYEGSYSQDSFVVDATLANQQYILSNPSIDTDSLSLSVTENGNTTVYSYAETLKGLNGNSQVYFIQATYNQQYEILFGDGVFGYTPINGAVVLANYISSNGSSGNGVKSFGISQDIGLYNGGYGSVATITTISPSTGGANSEGIESIRFNAPRYYQTQGSCVTSTDYETLILQNFPDVEYVNVFPGGITNTSVQFGTVYISPSTFSGTPLTNSRKNDIETYVNGLSVLGIQSQVIDPTYLFITLNSKVHVNFSNTSSTASVITSEVMTTIQNFNVDNLQNFNTAFRFSKLCEAIDSSDIGILSNETTTKLYTIFTPTLNTPYTINANYLNALQPGSISSSQFVVGTNNYIFTDSISGIDTGTGIIYQLENNANLTTPSYKKIGTVDYTNGIININLLSYTNIGGGIMISASTVNQDIYCTQNTIIEIDLLNSTITTVNG